MLSYPIEEAETMLSSKLGAAKASLANCEEDLDFLREQVTVGLIDSNGEFCLPFANLNLDNGGGCCAGI